MIVIGFCGLPGSGKSTALESVTDLGPIINMGDVIRNEAKTRRLALDDQNLGKIAEELRLIGGKDIIALKTIELIKDQKSVVVFVDGIRSLDELSVFRKIWKFPLIAVIAKKKNRYKWMKNRARSDDSNDIEPFRVRDMREINLGINKVIKLADYHIKNNSNKENLKRKTRNLILKLIGKKN